MRKQSYRWLLILVLTNVCVVIRAQSSADSGNTKRAPYAIVLTGGVGVSYYSAKLGVPPGLERVAIHRSGVPIMVRAMWFPDHRLRVGLETGRMMMYRYEGAALGQRSQVAVSAVPALLVFSMPLAWLSGTERSLARRLSIAGGTGGYFINSRLNYLGRVSANRFTLGWMAAAAYTQPINRRFRVAAELKRYSATATDDVAFALQLQLVWRTFSW